MFRFLFRFAGLVVIAISFLFVVSRYARRDSLPGRLILWTESVHQRGRNEWVGHQCAVLHVVLVVLVMCLATKSAVAV
jgi:hypothetical protein